MTKATEAKHRFGCPKCGAPVGEYCMSKAGKTVTNGHLDRLRLLDAGQEAFNEVLQSQDVVQSSWDAQVDREERVAQVMWAINFARTALLVPQDVLDRNLAEMIVGAEMDLKLF